ncbi:MAG: V-type ATP synthase subunit E family protein [Candidatus Hydrogenedentes bacterium]|nr:V-type ATP synthase subunit E family protein [Candidatus Hydrogenedentota bacterium]
MGLDNISRAVLEAAKNEADHIIKAARKNADDKIAAARAAAEHDGERKYQNAVHAIDEDLARQLIQARGAANKQILAKKNLRLRQVFDSARQKILAMPAPEYANLMRSLLDRSVGPLGGLVRVHHQDEKLFAQLLADLNKARTPETELKLDTANPLEDRGGFMFVGGYYEVDQTLATLLGDIERDLAPQIAAQLFAG